MTIDELIEQLQKIKEQYGEAIECCTYDWSIDDYTNNLCMETVTDDHYIDEETGKPVTGGRILLL